jgi:hypothetical protein
MRPWGYATVGLRDRLGPQHGRLSLSNHQEFVK